MKIKTLNLAAFLCLFLVFSSCSLFNHSIISHFETVRVKKESGVIKKSKPDELKLPQTTITADEVVTLNPQYTESSNLHPVELSDVIPTKINQLPQATNKPIEKISEQNTKSNTNLNNNNYSTGRKTDGFALTGFICSIVGFIIAGLIFGTLGIVFGAIGMGRILSNRGTKKGFGLALTALILGFIDVAFVIIYLAVTGFK